MDTDTYKQRLQTLERELDERINRELEKARDTTDDRPDPLDQSVVAELRDEYLGLAHTASEILDEVRAALGRIEAESYGLCAVDGERIAEARLDAVPWTRYCVQHQEELEQQAGMRTPRS